ncbi:MAG: hypothetical protein FJ276_30465, partial [Planctomycetes bacterium]|nr:hypothetical protein [Planctomycetota bacterium]
MTINVVCECGFSKQVPDSWKGRTVKCRCGRAFAVGHQDPDAATTGHAGADPSRSHAPSWNPDLYPPGTVPPGTVPPGTSAPEPAALVPSEPPAPKRRATPPAIDREPPAPEDREPPAPTRHAPPPAIDREPPAPEDREPPAPTRHAPPPAIDREPPVPEDREPPAPPRHKARQGDREPGVTADREPPVPNRPEPWPVADGGGAERDVEPSPTAAVTAILPEDDSSSVVARHRSRRRAARRKKGPLLVSLAFLALLGIAGAVYVIIEKPFSAKIVQAVPSPPVSPQEARSEGRAGEAERTIRAKTPRAGARRVGDPIELVPDDGLLLTGMFGDYAKELALSEEQQEKIGELTEQLRGKEGELRERKSTVEQWMTDGQAVAAELLAVLNDEQRSQLQASLQRGSIVRTAMVDYGARIRPELSIPRMEWTLNRDRGRFLPVEKSSIAGPAGYGCYRSAQATGGFAVTREYNRGESRRSIDVWNLSEDRLVGRFEIQTKG